jgi:AraC-like DNA-binding protein
LSKVSCLIRQHFTLDGFYVTTNGLFMRLRISDPVLSEVIFERELPGGYTTDHAIEQSQIEIDHNIGRASMRDMWFDGLHLSHGSVQLYKNMTVKAECDTPVIEMHFGLSGNSEAIFVGDRLGKFGFAAGQHNISYMPEFEGYLKSDRQNEAYQMLEIHITDQYFKRFANAESKLLDQFQNKILNKKASMISPENRSITVAMNSILQEIVKCQRQGIMKRLFVEARMLELLMLQVEQFESGSRTISKETFKSADIEKLHHARNLIEQNISFPYTLAQLSRMVGLNDFKLKKGFRETFGTTVFGYLHELRMQEAKRLLRDTSKSIHDISDYCGYAYVQHFTTAFRNKFGFTPGSFRE